MEQKDQKVAIWEEEDDNMLVKLERLQRRIWIFDPDLRFADGHVIKRRVPSDS